MMAKRPDQSMTGIVVDTALLAEYDRLIQLDLPAGCRRSRSGHIESLIRDWVEAQSRCRGCEASTSDAYCPTCQAENEAYTRSRK